MHRRRFATEKRDTGSRDAVSSFHRAVAQTDVHKAGRDGRVAVRGRRVKGTVACGVRPRRSVQVWRVLCDDGAGHKTFQRMSENNITILTLEQLRAWLREEIQRKGGVKKMARDFDVSSAAM